METLPRNGSYVQRRKMYVELPLHNMKSKVPIDWNSDQQPTYERHRSIAKEINEREYIKRVYDLKMERKLKERWNAEGGDTRIGRETSIINEKEALAKQLEEFNTSKLMPKSSNKNNNPEYAEQQQSRTPSVSSKQGERMYSEQQRSYANPHPFRNHLPDRLEEFLREKTKADRKSAIVVNLKDR